MLHAEDNASRCTAVLRTKVVPPGTAAAADIEQQLLLLSRAGAPVLDLRHLQEPAAAAAAAAQQQQQEQEPEALRTARAVWQKLWRARLPGEGQDTLLAAREPEAGDDAQAEVMAALVSQLPQLLPGLEVLVLPIRLPGGR